MRVLGIDPGFTGALALISDRSLVEVADMPMMFLRKGGKPQVDIDQVRELIASWKPDVAVIEAVGPAPSQGAGSMFRFGFATGQVAGLVRGMDVPLVRVPPHVWKEAMRLAGGKSGKKQAREMASHLWPSGDFFRRVRDDGRAEAALLAHWGLLSGQCLATLEALADA